MTIEMDKIFTELSTPYGRDQRKKHVKSDNKTGFNHWIPKDVERFNYVLTNPSKVQSYTVGLERGMTQTLHPGDTIKLRGDNSSNFEYWTGRLIVKGLIHLSIEDLSEKKEPKPEPEITVEKKEAPKKGFCECGRRLSPMNKTGVCLYCRKKK